MGPGLFVHQHGVSHALIDKRVFKVCLCLFFLSGYCVVCSAVARHRFKWLCVCSTEISGDRDAVAKIKPKFDVSTAACRPLASYVSPSPGSHQAAREEGTKLPQSRVPHAAGQQADSHHLH